VILSECGSEKEHEKRSQGLNSFQDHNRHVECRDVGMNIKEGISHDIKHKSAKVL
jgi:hypothetical protein